MAEIAAALQRALTERACDGSAGRATPRVIARGTGWAVADVLCTSGPSDEIFEEQQSQVSIALVLAGTFQYRSALGEAVMTPGSAMLVNPAQGYECGHEHGSGDRCVAFWYAPEYFERVAADVGARQTRFATARVPAVTPLSSVVAQAAARILTSARDGWEELSLRVAATTVTLAGNGQRQATSLPPQALRRVTDAVRSIELRADSVLTLSALATEAGLSPYHFLRCFERVTGTTPHQYLRRARLRDAAVRLMSAPGQVLSVALDCGFGDVSNFNRAFRAEFGMSPREFRRRPRTLRRRPA